MNHIDLFSGIGGFALAGTWTWGYDYHNIAHSEVEPYACKVYHRHFPESECLGDITKINWQRFKGKIDLLTGGFPCQPHSVAGKRGGSKDERDLWGECVRALAGIRPRYAIFENVPGIITSEHGRTWERIKVDLEASGYEGLPILLSAANIGAKHKRTRVWIVAHDAKRAYGAHHTESTQGQKQKLGKSISEDNVADTKGNDEWGSRQISQRREMQAGGRSGIFLNPPIEGLPDWSGGEMGQPWPVTEFERPDGEDVGNAERGGLEGEPRGRAGAKPSNRHSRKGREVERDFRGVAHGVSHRVDRLKGLGNAIAPRCAFVIMQAIKNIQHNEPPRTS